VPEAAAAARGYSRFALALVVLTSVVDAKEVTLSHKGLTLNANLELAAGKTLADGAVLLTHGSLAHNGMEIITYFQSLLKEKGYNTLAINLSLGLDNRHGMYDCKVTHRHRNEDAAEEIGVWVNWLKQQGTKRVTVMGHSRGGTQTALYAAGQPDAAVNAVVLLAPATRENNDAARYQQLFGKPLAPWVERAQQRVQDGQGGAVMEHTALMTCADAPVTAASFVSYYGPQARIDTLAMIPRIRKPVLVVVAGNDSIVIGLEKKVAPLADGKRVRVSVVDGADHFFRDLYADDAVEVIVAFLKDKVVGF
jgi:pimeloyl-ACP methyl ester carboxylesterase